MNSESGTTQVKVTVQIVHGNFYSRKEYICRYIVIKSDTKREFDFGRKEIGILRINVSRYVLVQISIKSESYWNFEKFGKNIFTWNKICFWQRKIYFWFLQSALHHKAWPSDCKVFSYLLTHRWFENGDLIGYMFEYVIMKWKVLNKR